MELLNATAQNGISMTAGYTMGMQPDGRELLVVVVKGTFQIPRDSSAPKLLEKQNPLVDADTFTGEPGLSAPIYESDYAPFKPRCDVVLLGSAHAPGGLPARQVRVALSVGQIYKQFDVVGNRVWSSGFLGAEATDPEPFTVLPLTYDVASGGVDNLSDDPNLHEAHPDNPIGRGFFPQSRGSDIDGKPLPNTEEPGNSIKDPRVPYNPMGFGPIGRSWAPRPKYAGTYDQDWIDNVFPFLPSDFDERYHQCAPPDQQIAYLQGGEDVLLVNLTAEGKTAFSLPKIDLPVTFYFKNYEEKVVTAQADTLLIEPDLDRFTILWRASLPLRKNIFEVAQAVVGRMPRAWYRARELGKTYYPSLKALVDQRRAERQNTEESEVEESEV